MDVAFADKSMRNLCESDSKATRTLGADVASTLKARLADLLAAEHVGELVSGAPRTLDGTLHGHLTMELGPKIGILLAINHTMPPTDASGQIDWARVRRLKVIRIGEL